MSFIVAPTTPITRTTPTASASPTDAELLGRYARRRDEEAFARLVARHMRGVRLVAYRYTRHRQAAEDVAQAAFLVLAQRPRAAMRSARWRKTALPWLAKVCRYAAANWRRAEERRLRHETQAASRAPAHYDPTAGPELAEAVRSALACLPRRDRRIVELRHLSQMPWDQVARHAGTTPEAARKAGTRALSQLRVILEKRGITAGGAAILAGLRAMTTTTTSHAAASAVGAASAPEMAKGVLVMMNLKSYATAAVTTLAAVGIVAAGIAVSQPEPSPAAQGRPAATVPADPAPFTIDLGAGGKLEVLWLAEHKPDGRAWHADGTLLSKRPAELPFYIERIGLVEIWLKHSSETGSASLSYTAEPLADELELSEILNWDQDERRRHVSVSALRRANLQYVVVDPRDGAQQLGLDVRGPVDEWQILQQWGPGAPQPRRERTDYIAGGSTGGTDGTSERSVRTSWFARGLSGWELKVQLVTKDGRTLNPRGGTPINWIEAGRIQTGDVTFDDVQLQDLDYFQILGRPRGLIRIRGLAPAPGARGNPVADVSPGYGLPWDRQDAE